LQQAFESIQESESTFVEMLKDPMMYGLEDWVLEGLTATRYNASLLLYRVGDEENAQKLRDVALQSLAGFRHRDEKWEFLDRAVKALLPEQSDQPNAGSRPHADSTDMPAPLPQAEPWNIDSEDTRSILFPVTDPPNMRVLLHANMVDDFIAVEVGNQLRAVLPTGARHQLEFAATFMESESAAGRCSIDIPAAAGVRAGAVTVWCSRIDDAVWLEDESRRPFAGFERVMFKSGKHGIGLLQSLLG
jgi:hypothetical protein